MNNNFAVKNYENRCARFLNGPRSEQSRSTYLSAS